jgi:hypothetical protein
VRQDLQDKLVLLDLPDQLDLLAERAQMAAQGPRGKQDKQDLLALAVHLGLLAKLVRRVLLDPRVQAGALVSVARLEQVGKRAKLDSLVRRVQRAVLDLQGLLEPAELQAKRVRPA